MSWLERNIRALTAPMRALPGFIILGVQKGGTTSVYRYLNQHPQVFAAATREVHFFDLNYAKGIDAYRFYFPLQASMKARQRKLRKPVFTGESSPYYLFHPHSPDRMREVVPDVKLIVALRDPVERAYSHFTHNRRKGREERSFAAAVEEELERFPGEARRVEEDGSIDSEFHRHFSYVHRGFYAEQIERYFARFPRESLFVLASEDLFARPRETMDTVCAFLGIGPMPDGVDFVAHNSQSYGDSPDVPTIEKLRETYRPHNEALEKLLGRKFAWK